MEEKDQLNIIKKLNLLCMNSVILVVKYIKTEL